MLVCTICGLTAESLDGFEIVRTGNRATIVLDKDGLGHNLQRTQDPSEQALNATNVNHRRWHVARGITNPRCSLCQKEKS